MQAVQRRRKESTQFGPLGGPMAYADPLDYVPAQDCEAIANKLRHMMRHLVVHVKSQQQ